MASYETPAPGIRVVQLRLDCKGVIDWAETQEDFDWEESTTTDEVDDDYRTSSTLFLPFHSYDNDPLIDTMNRKVYDAMVEYSFDYEIEFSDIENVSLQRYTKGQRYGEHYDDDPADAPRIFSAVLYLNNTGGGGETYFKHFDVTVTPKPGQLAIFPANYVYMHEALPPKRTKYAAAYWAMP